MDAARDTRLSALESVLADLLPGLFPEPAGGRGRPALIPGALLWAGMLVCILRQDGSQRAIWRLLTLHGLWAWPRLTVSDDAIYQRLQRAGPAPMERLFAAVTDLLWTGPADAALAPFAAEVVALDETTLDQVPRRGRHRGIPRGDDRLLPGKVSALFDLRRQLYRRVRLHDQYRENEKVPAAEMVADLPAASLILTDLGYFSFPWYDALTDAEQHWIARLREKTTFEIRHRFWAQDGSGEYLVWLGTYRSDKAKHLVRLIEIQRGTTTHRYLTNVTDPWTLSAAAVVQLYARRWDIELAFKTLKTDLGLDVLWSGKWPVIQTQVWAMLVIAQLAAHLRFLVAQAAQVDLFDVSLRLLLRSIPQLVVRGDDPLTLLPALKYTGGIIRDSRRTVYTVPDPPALARPPDDLVRKRTPRYAGRRCGLAGTDRRPA